MSGLGCTSQALRSDGRASARLIAQRAAPVQPRRISRTHSANPQTVQRAAAFPLSSPQNRCPSRQRSARQFVRTHAAAVETEQVTTEQLSVTYLGLLDDKYTVSGQLSASASTDEVYSILTDYQASSRIFNNIASSEIEYRDGQKILSQGCKWQFLVFGGEFKVDFTVSEQPEQLKLSFCLLESSFMQAFEGRWQVRPAAGGQGCVVEHQLAVMPFVALPPAVEAYAGKIFVQQVSAILADLQAELRRREQ